MCSLSKEPSLYQGRQFKMHFFFRIMPPFRFRFFILYQAPHCGALAPSVLVHIPCRLKHFVMTIKLTGQQSIIMRLQVNIIDCANIEVPGMSYKTRQILLEESIHPQAPLCRNSRQHSAF